MEQGGFRDVSLEEVRRIGCEESEKYAREHFAELDSKRTAYLLKRNQREIQEVVEDYLAEEIIKGNVKSGDKVFVTTKNKAIAIVK